MVFLQLLEATRKQLFLIKYTQVWLKYSGLPLSLTATNDCDLTNIFQVNIYKGSAWNTRIEIFDGIETNYSAEHFVAKWTDSSSV